MLSRASACVAILVNMATVATAASACSSVQPDPIQLDGNLFTVDNRTEHEWRNVEIWLNRYYRMTARSIPPGGRFQTSLDNFVEGYGRRFDFRRAQVTDLRLTAKLPDGKPYELAKKFERGGLEGALEGLGGR